MVAYAVSDRSLAAISLALSSGQSGRSVRVGRVALIASAVALKPCMLHVGVACAVACTPIGIDWFVVEGLPSSTNI